MRNGLWRNFCERSLIMSHEDFVLGYQNGGLGCSVSTLLILRLFLVGRVREMRVVIPLVRWSLVSLLLIGLTIIGFLCLPAVWALLGTIMLLGIFALAFVDQVGWLIVSTALIDEDCYHFALAERVLYVFTDGRVTRHYPGRSLDPSYHRCAPAAAALPRWKLRTVIEYIMENLGGSLTLEQMAAVVHLSPHHFARQFKAATGLPPHQYVIARRVERAQHLLRADGELGLGEVAFRAGFSDQIKFSFHFKRIVGVTPRQFRISARKA
jgi:AraC-like DNA-binding protein